MGLALAADGQGWTPIIRAKTRASEAQLLQCLCLWDAGALATQSVVLSATSWDAGALGAQSLVQHHAAGPAALMGEGDCP